MNATLWSAIKSEWIKFRSVRSTWIGLATFIVLTIGIGLLVTFTISGHINDHGGENRIGFDPTVTSLVGLFLAQFAVGVIGIVMMTGEYASGAIRTTLTAIPRRLRLVAAKKVILAISMFVVSEVTVFAAFLIGQAVYHRVNIGTSLGAPGVCRSVFLAGVYLTLLALLGFGIGIILRTTAFSIMVYTAILLIIPVIVNFLPQSWKSAVTKYLPSELGQSMFTPHGSPSGFSWLPALLVLLAYVGVVLVAGIAVLEKRDA